MIGIVLYGSYQLPYKVLDRYLAQKPRYRVGHKFQDLNESVKMWPSTIFAVLQYCDFPFYLQPKSPCKPIGILV